MEKEKLEMSRKKKVCIVFIILFVILAISVIIAVIFRKGIILEQVYYAIQIISALFVIGGVIIAIWQYILTSKRENELRKEEIEEVKRIRNKEAIQLTEYYKDNIIDKISIINIVYRETHILDILEGIMPELMKNFDKNELEKLLSKADRDNLEEKRKSKEFEKIILSHADYFGIDLDRVEDKDKQMVEKMIIQNFKTLSQQLLNNLEYFAMSFNCEIAEETTVYQSLHQTYIRIVSHMYYEISSNNASGEQKLYTNVIKLFNKWNARALEQKDTEANAIRSVINK